MKRAFSLPELLVTLVIFSFGLLPLIVLFQKSHKVNAQAKNLLVAQSIGRVVIEDIRSYGFEGVAKNYTRLVHTNKEVEGGLIPTENNDPPQEDEIVFPDYFKRFNTTVSIIPNPNDDPTAAKFLVGLTVEWLEPGREGGKYSLQFGTVLVKHHVNE